MVRNLLTAGAAMLVGLAILVAIWYYELRKMEKAKERRERP